MLGSAKSTISKINIKHENDALSRGIYDNNYKHCKILQFSEKHLSVRRLKILNQTRRGRF